MKSDVMELRALAIAAVLATACGETAHGNPSGGSGASSSAGSATAGAPAAGTGGGATGGGSMSGGMSSGGTVAAGAATGGSSASGAAGSAGALGSGGAESTTGPLTVRLDRPKQVMDGFGISNTFASEELDDATADALFDVERGIGLSILRIGMRSNGEPSVMTTFEDAKRAVARGVTSLMVSVPTAFGQCKTNGIERDGGHLIADDGGLCYEQWSDRIAAFPAKVKDAVGIEPSALSFANEPDFASCGTEKPCDGQYDSMLYTADEAVAFLKVLGPKLRQASPNLKIMTPEPREWLHLWSNDTAEGATDPLGGRGYDYGHALARDAAAWNLIDVVATHQYETQLAEPWPSDVPQTKPVWQTEMSGIRHWPEQGPSRDIDNGLVVAGWIHDAVVNASASAWLWFWFKEPFSDVNEGLLLKDGTDTKRRYTLGNFSRFVRPGYARVGIDGSPVADVLLSAFQGAEGTLVIVAVNRGSADVALPIAIFGGSAPAVLTPWITSAADNLAQKLDVPVAGGSFTAALPAKSVMTFVGN